MNVDDENGLVDQQEEVPEVTPEASTEATTAYAEVMRLLLESPRFVTWFNLNYTLRKYVDDETKTVEFRLFEIPVETVCERITEMERAAGLQPSSPPTNLVFNKTPKLVF